MCRTDLLTTKSALAGDSKKAMMVLTKEPKPQSVRLLLSLDSFVSRDHVSGKMPNMPSIALTTAVVVAFLTASEMLCRKFLHAASDWHDVLETTVHRHILARHIGVDVFSCAIASYLGWQCIHQYTGHVLPKGLFGSMGGSSNEKNDGSSKPVSGDYHLCWPAVEKRAMAYQPAACRLGLFFIIYQIKNLYDTIVWNDGPEFIFHHVFSLITAWGSVRYGLLHYYTFFYLGVSEISTAVLCLLANFDDEHGVPGLGDAMPLTKIAIGGAFVVLFIICRCIVWPVTSFHFIRDVLQVLEKLKENSNSNNGGSSNSAEINTQRRWFYFFLVSLSSLSVLQLLWLGQIFIIAQEEITKAGLL